MDNNTFQEHADMHSFLGGALGNGAAAVNYAERYPQHILLKARKFTAMILASGRPVLFALPR
jgi:hypothetical protein